VQNEGAFGAEIQREAAQEGAFEGPKKGRALKGEVPTREGAP